MSVLEYMRSLDPDYGSQHHQREYIDRMARADAANPCTRDHTASDPPAHTPQCYPRRPDGRVVGL